MLVNTILEMAGVDDALSARASQHLAAFQAMFEDFLVEAGHEPLRARELAALLMVLNEGIRVSSRRDLPPEEQLMPIQATFRLIRKRDQLTRIFKENFFRRRWLPTRNNSPTSRSSAMP